MYACLYMCRYVSMWRQRIIGLKPTNTVECYSLFSFQVCSMPSLHHALTLSDFGHVTVFHAQLYCSWSRVILNFASCWIRSRWKVFWLFSALSRVARGFRRILYPHRSSRYFLIHDVWSNFLSLLLLNAFNAIIKVSPESNLLYTKTNCDFVCTFYLVQQSFEGGHPECGMVGFLSGELPGFAHGV